jgi:DNA-binding winged helix-turn-helix (wHTH) protein
MSLELDSAVGERLKFGEFELAPVARALWRRGEQVRLGSRALDILIALASRPGQILSKDDLTKLVWRGALVDETGLRVGISAVRKALGTGGDRYIATVPGRGYCFVLDVETTAPKPTPEPPHFKRLKPQRLSPSAFQHPTHGHFDAFYYVSAPLSDRLLLALKLPAPVGDSDCDLNGLRSSLAPPLAWAYSHRTGKHPREMALVCEAGEFGDLHERQR